MFNAKASVLLVLALVLGSVAAFMANGWIQGKATVDTAAGGDSTLFVYAAAREIPYGKSVDPSYLKKIAWPANSLPEGVILASEDLEGKFVNQTILPGELLMDARVVEKLTGSRLSAVVTPNKRAISVRVNDVAGVAGFLLPGNRVDVLATRMEDRRAVTVKLLQNIRVLAVDQKANPAKDDPIVVRAVTLESDLDQAAMLASATEEGTIQLVLRNPDDDTTEPELMAAEPVVITESVQMPVVKQVVRKISEPRHQVTIIRGTQVIKTSTRM